MFRVSDIKTTGDIAVVVARNILDNLELHANIQHMQDYCINNILNYSDTKTNKDAFGGPEESRIDFAVW